MSRGSVRPKRPSAPGMSLKTPLELLSPDLDLKRLREGGVRWI
ncbi:MAG: hypothetical protein ABDI20_02270 [Candidatus Bipolaricaulaceae bacterium]